MKRTLSRIGWLLACVVVYYVAGSVLITAIQVIWGTRLSSTGNGLILLVFTAAGFCHWFRVYRNPQPKPDPTGRLSPSDPFYQQPR